MIVSIDDKPAKILVIGCVSRDTIRLEQPGGGSTHVTLGGAALYTALAARSAGSEVTLLAPRPQPGLPWLDIFSGGVDAVSELSTFIQWVGPVVPPSEMPFLEIVHHGGGRATLLNAGWKAEGDLS